MCRRVAWTLFYGFGNCYDILKFRVPPLIFVIFVPFTSTIFPEIEILVVPLASIAGASDVSLVWLVISLSLIHI